MSVSTVSGILTRIGLGRLGRLGVEPAQRCERARPGELIHIDVKKLGRIVGGAGHRITGREARGRYAAGSFTDATGRRRSKTRWEFVHVAIDDATRLAYAEVLPDEQAGTAVEFLRCALAFYASYGIAVERVITDNGSAYRSAIHAIACRALGIRHLRTRRDARRPTARQNASSARCSATGPTARSTAQAENAPQPLTAGYSSTTIAADTQASVDKHPSPA
jgi:hypothetical protein